MKKILGFLVVCFLVVSCSSQQTPEVSNYEKGIEEAHNAQYAQAIEFFNVALDETTDDEKKADILYNIGFCYGVMNEFEKEIEYYNKSLEAFPDFQPALHDLADYYYKTDDLDNALKMYEKIVEVNPEDEEAHYTLALIQDALGNKKESTENMQKAEDLDSQEKDSLGEEVIPAE